MHLTDEEKAILNGGQGQMMQRVMATIVTYGEALEAERLVGITGSGHFVIAHAIPGIAPSMEMLDDLIAAGLQTAYPFTVDPAAPLDVDNWRLTESQTAKLRRMYREQALYDRKLKALGCRGPDGYTCTPYLPEVGNTPRRGDILAWSESACVVFANAVLGARTNRNGAIIDLLCNIAGKVPLSGFLTDEGRRATWCLRIKTRARPLPQLLGAAIGRLVLADVPYIVGLDRFLGGGIDADTRDYLHELGAAAAAAGAVGLFHVENVTPEAVDAGPAIMDRDCQTAVIDEDTLADLTASYPVLWHDAAAAPAKCFLGCPHLSRNQLQKWSAAIENALQRHGRRRLAVHTTICAAPPVLQAFAKSRAWRRLIDAGVRFSPACAMQLFDNDLSRDDAVITNSTKLRTYTHARFFPDDDIADIVVTGRLRHAP